MNWETGEEDGTGWGGIAPSAEEKRQERELRKEATDLAARVAHKAAELDDKRWKDYRDLVDRQDKELQEAREALRLLALKYEAAQSALRAEERTRLSSLQGQMFQCTKCGVIRFEQLQACACGAATWQTPFQTFAQLKLVQAELDEADYTAASTRESDLLMIWRAAMPIKLLAEGKPPDVAVLVDRIVELLRCEERLAGIAAIHPTIRKGLGKIVDGRPPDDEFERGFLEASRAVLVQADALEAHPTREGQRSIDDTVDQLHRRGNGVDY